MANAAVDLTSLEKLQNRLKMAGAVLSAGDEADMARLVTELSRRMHTEIGLTVIYGARSDTKDGTGGTRCWLDAGALSAGEDQWTVDLTSVVVDDSTIPQSVGGADGWKLVGKSRLDLVGSTYRFSEGTANVVITYSAGFKITPSWSIPEDIEGAVIECAALKWLEGDRIGQTTKIVAGENVNFQGSNVWATFFAVARAYRPVVV